MTTSVAELAFQCLQHETDMRPTMDEVLKTLERISNDEHAEEESVASGVLKDVQPPASPECDEVVLLKDTRPPLSPNSVTDKWLSAASISGRP
ncbi:hypothetical protein RJ641_003328 [Dillenia turbinata]|uniref:Uncharacterized protein n=1 Tax=Dillenia turbinata TaxID=194707 RepID=A0AAN8VCL6_9MAGN